MVRLRAKLCPHRNVLLVGALAMLGCSEVAGLGDLRFEPASSPGGGSASSATGAGGVVNSGNAGGTSASSTSASSASSGGGGFAPAVCDGPDEELNDANGHCYFMLDFSSAPASWTSALSSCGDRDASLVGVVDQYEWDFITLTFSPPACALNNGARTAWIGGKDMTSEDNEFYWVNGDLWDFELWELGEPRAGANSDCILFDQVSGKWRDVGCFAGTCNAICERNATPL